ncbi:alpha/beta fold hydrolase [Herbiconiux sp. L3-i23]|uniref:alpha/beta fold hydrolase n=1 Tax=Herbiconiux sp. L3-i23 TaxID=2905871 RepID=UPI0020679439|nr:alpha/beta fold hydrolase [Herbiconiux sp. L3-i23]BDI22493.1 hypothetical protein L3i23_12690 [Herbiconiux sp. L3-i23]
MTATLVVVVADDLPVDADLFDETVAGAARRRDWVAEVRRVPRAALPTEIDSAAASPVLLVPGMTVGATELEFRDRVDSAPVTRFDLGRRPRDTDPRVRHHLSGLGLDHMAWAVLAAIDAARSPAERVSYGGDVDQYVDVRRPAESRGTVVLLHGGFYRSRWQASLMDDLAIDLASAGLTALNVEYRRPDVHDWAETVADVREAILLAVQIAPGPLVLVGLSAGAQLALQAAEHVAAGGDIHPTLAVSLTGVLDVVEADARFMGEGAVQMALGGRPSELPADYADASPMAVRHNSVPWLVVETDRDSLDFREMARRLARAATGPVDTIEGEGDHFTVLDSGSAVWRRTRERILAAVEGGRR